MHIFRFIVLPVTLMTGAAVFARIQPVVPASNPADSPSSSVSALAPAVVDPEMALAAANAALGRATVLYKGYKTYSDVMHVNYDIRVRTQAGENPQTMEDALTMRFAGPERFSLKNSEAAFFADGKSKTVHLKPTGRFLRRDDADWATVAGSLRAILDMHPVLTLLTDRVVGDRIFPFLDEVTGSGKGTVEGQAALLVRGKARVPFGFDADPVDVTLAFADSDGALLSVEFDLIDSMKRMYARQLAELKLQMDKLPPEQRQQISVEPLRWKLTLRLTEVVKNPEFAAGEFVFTPGPKDKPVESFAELTSTLAEPPSAESLIGSEAPVFAVPLLGRENAAPAERALDLSSLRGKVVVLDFWATWCAPCVAAMPELVKLAAAFEGTDVVFVGVNQDRGQTDKVTKFVEENKVMFRQVLDKEGEIAGRFNIRAIPTLFVLDKQGIIRAVHSGFGPGQEQEIRRKIELTLAGKFEDGGGVRDAEPGVPEADGKASKPKGAAPDAVKPGETGAGDGGKAPAAQPDGKPATEPASKPDVRPENKPQPDGESKPPAAPAGQPEGQPGVRPPSGPK